MSKTGRLDHIGRVNFDAILPHAAHSKSGTIRFLANVFSVIIHEG